MTTKGSGSFRVTPSTVAFPSSITSSRADWVLGEVRLISSARNKLQNTAPSRNSNSLVLLLYMEKPKRSLGRTSGVN